MSTFNKKRNYFVCGWVGKVLFVFLNVDLNLLSKISKNQHLNFIKFSFFGGGWVGKSKNEIIAFFIKC